MKFNMGYLCIAIMSISVCAYTGQSAAQSKLSSPNLSGSIVDDVGSSPIENANIWIHEWSGKSLFVVQSDMKGHYTANLPNGVYFVLIGAEGFVPVCKSILIQTGKPIIFSVRLVPDTVFELRD
jgi:hypothetical protein